MEKKKCIFVLDASRLLSFFFFFPSSFPELNVWCIYRIQGEYLRVANDRAAFEAIRKLRTMQEKVDRVGAGEKRPRAEGHRGASPFTWPRSS